MTNTHTATLRDVYYALEHMSEKLCRWPSSNALKPSDAWSMEPSGVKVPKGIANEARNSGNVMSAGEGSRREAVYVWRK